MRYFVKTYFNRWKEVDKEHFGSWRNTIRSGAVAMTTAEKERYIHKRTIILRKPPCPAAFFLNSQNNREINLPKNQRLRGFLEDNRNIDESRQTMLSGLQKTRLRRTKDGLRFRFRFRFRIRYRYR